MARHAMVEARCGHHLTSRIPKAIFGKPTMSKSCNLRKNSEIIFVALVLLMMASVCPARAQTIVNLQQLTQDLDLQQRLYRDVQLEVTVCAASRPKVGVLIVQDGSGVELLDVGNLGQEIHPGERIRLQGHHCLLRKRDTGIEISAEPVVNNDGVHNQRSLQGEATLKAGQNQIRLDCFNSIQNFNLNVTYWVSNGPPQDFSTSNFWHAVVDDSGRTNFLPGLRAECYEGDYWQAIPEISLLEPTRTGTVASFDIGFRTRDEMVAIRYDGYFNVPDDGKYLFRVHSRDGSILWLGKPELPILHIGKTNLPEASRGYYAEQMNSLLERRWITLEGHVNAVSKTAEGLELELGPDRDMVRVWVADAAGLDVSPLRNARVKVTGIGRGVLTSDHRIVLGKVFVASSKEIALIEKASDREPSVPIASIGQVRSLSLEDARHALPVRIQGVVTEVINYKAGRGLVLQDDMRGIYVNAFAASNISSALGQFLEVEGHTATGYFAPVINADKITYLGEGRLPEPAHPSWAELLNGSMDSQWTELNGLVTDVKSNVVTLLLPEGRLDVRMDGHKESELKSYEKNFVHICGVLGASWNAANREVQVGYVKMRNATVSIDASAPTDPFDAIVKTPRDLLRFDPQATAFRRVKVRGTIVYADATQVFLEQDGAGLRLLPADKTEVHPGDLVEAVGYPEIGRTALTLREVILRKTGEIPLPTANKLNNSELTQQGLDSTRVRITGQLLGWHPEQRTLVLEMQSGAHLYFARLPQAESLSLRIGSQLALDGVYVSQGQNLWTGARADFFELLLNSSEDIVVISQAPWWTLKRLLIFVHTHPIAC
jgi:hypothetical protein